MISSSVSVLFAATAALVGAQVSFNKTSNTFSCPVGATAFCAGDSLITNIIIRCGNGTAYPGNCNDNLAGLPPIGVKSSALCYQSSPTAGDAACSFNGTVYPESGATPFKIRTNSTTSSPKSPTNSTSSSYSGISSTTPTSAPQQSYGYGGGGGASSHSTSEDEQSFFAQTTFPITATQSFSLVTASATPFPPGTPAQGFAAPSNFNGTVPEYFGTPTAGSGFGTAMPEPSPSPFVGGAAASKKGGRHELIIGICMAIGATMVLFGL